MYNGYLIKIIGQSGQSDYIVPLSLISQSSFKGTVSTLDSEGYRDADGILHRTAVLQVPHCSFETRPHLTNIQLGNLWSNLKARYVPSKELEKRITAQIYVQEWDDYYQADFYIPDTEMIIDHIEGNTIIYTPVTFEFIGYGKRVEV